MRRITAKDVATLAGVDRSTVSRVLNDAAAREKYAPQTVARVRRAAKDLGYRPSMAARALRTGRAMLVGMVVPEIAWPFFAELASHVEHLAWEHGYRVVICSTSENAQRLVRRIADLVSRGIDGLIVSPCSDAALGGIRSVVAIDRPAATPDIPFVGLDNHKAGRLLGELLVERGYRSIGVVIPDCDVDPTLRCRFEGLSDALGSGGGIEWLVEAPVDPQLIQNVHARTARKLRQGPRPDAIIGLTSSCTLGVLEALAELGIAWGDDVGLAGVDDFAGAEFMKPAITVVAQPIEQIAATAFATLFDRMNEADADPAGRAKHHLLEPVLLARDSLPPRKET